MSTFSVDYSVLVNDGSTPSWIPPQDGHGLSFETAPYDYLGLPWHRSFRADAKPLVPGEPVALDCDLLPTSTIVKKGSRLRLVVSGADSRQRMDPPIGDPPVITVYAGGEHASYVSIPIIPEYP
jgi:hypothetical protein